jgi:hypothetical protein
MSTAIAWSTESADCGVRIWASAAGKSAMPSSPSWTNCHSTTPFHGATHPRAIELSQQLSKLMAEDGVGTFHFSSGGSDAVEGALKLAAVEA